MFNLEGGKDMCTLRNYSNQKYSKRNGNGFSGRIINPVPMDILGDFWMTHSDEYRRAEKVRGRLISMICALGVVLSATAVLAGTLTLMVWLVFRAEFILCLVGFYIFSLPCVILDQIFRRTYESVRMGFDRGTVLKQAFFGRSIGIGFCYWRWMRW
jgi:hypothetical protein